MTGSEPTVRYRRAAFTPQGQERWLDERHRDRHAGQACLVVLPAAAGDPQGLARLLPGSWIAVNEAAHRSALQPLAADCVGAMVLDHGCLMRNLRELVRSEVTPVFTGNTPDDDDTLLGYLNELGILRIPNNHTEGLGDSFGRFVNGGDDVFAAVQLAVVMGFQTIGILGLGAAHDDGVQFHPSGGWQPGAPQAVAGGARTRARLERARPLFELLGVELVSLDAPGALPTHRDVDAAGWRALVDQRRGTTRRGIGERLRGRFGGRLALDLAVRRPVAGADEPCFGGATNVAGAGSFQLLPACLDPFHRVDPQGRDELTTRVADGPRPPAAGVPDARALDLMRQARGVRLLASAPAAVEERLAGWRATAQAEELLEPLEWVDAPPAGIAGRALLLRAEAEDAASMESLGAYLGGLLAGGPAVLIAAVRRVSAGENGHAAPLPGGTLPWQDLLGALAERGHLLGYAECEEWLTLACTPVEAAIA